MILILLHLFLHTMISYLNVNHRVVQSQLLNYVVKFLMEIVMLDLLLTINDNQHVNLLMILKMHLNVEAFEKKKKKWIKK